MSQKPLIASPLTDKYQSDGWSGDAFAVSLSFAQRLERDRAELIVALESAIEESRRSTKNENGCKICDSEWHVDRAYEEHHTSKCLVPKYKATLKHVKRRFSSRYL